MDDVVKPSAAQIKALPGVDHYNRMYANSLAHDDKKALKLYKEYESADWQRKLRIDVTNVKNGRVDEKVCDRIIGKKRKSRHQNYEGWGQVMLIWLAQKY